MSIKMKKAFSFQPHEEIAPGLYYCKSKDLYFYKGRVYDQLSASHNGLIGMGAMLKNAIKEKV